VEQFRCFCAENKLGFIEDAAQSLGSYYNGKHLGRFGDIGSFSFSVPKIITMGQGGALITDNDLLAEKIGYLKDFGRKGGGNDIHHCIGYNFKLTDLQAVIGCEQIKKLPQRLIRKKEIYSRYVENLKDITEVCFINTELSQTSPWFIDLYVPNPDELAEYLKSYNIGTRRIYPPIHTQQAYQNLNHLNFPVTEKYCSRGLWLPSSIKLSDIQIDYICDNIIHYYGV
jgi:perosamine synthetase